jgi:hypothetical protein
VETTESSKLSMDASVRSSATRFLGAKYSELKFHNSDESLGIRQDTKLDFQLGRSPLYPSNQYRRNNYTVQLIAINLLSSKTLSAAVLPSNLSMLSA